MKAEILSTGDEVLLGQIVDTNSSWLCEKLKEIGIIVQQINAIGDDKDTISKIIQAISQRTDLCFVTGGLGPTQDDLTAAACAIACNDELKLNDQAYASMEAFFENRGYVLTKANEKQAYLPSKSTMVENHNGTAPGFFITLNQCCFFFMPGVPSEMKLMFEHEIKPQLFNTYELDDFIFMEKLTVFGLGESMVGSLLKNFNSEFPKMRLGFRASFPFIEVKIVFQGAKAFATKATKAISKAKQWAIDRLENKVISSDGLSMPEEIGRLLAKRKQTLAIAESCTGGLISNMITDVAGSSEYFLFSATTYSNEAKMNVLKVNQDTIIKNGAVHEDTALEMAKGVKKVAGSDFAVSTTGIAGPSGGTDEKPVGMVCVGIAGPKRNFSKTFIFPFEERDKNKKIFAAAALELLRREIVSL